MKRIRVLLAVAVLAALVPGSSRAATTVQVFMSLNRFCTTPVCAANENVTIAAGDTVEWVFSDPECVAFHAVGCYHTSTALRNDGSVRWTSPAMPGPPPTLGAPSPVLAYARTFNAAGTFGYFCAVHAGGGMTATVIVQG